MDRPKLIKCEATECNEMIIEGPYCFRHAKRKAVIGGYLKRNMDRDHTVWDKPMDAIDKTNSKET